VAPSDGGRPPVRPAVFAFAAVTQPRRKVPSWLAPPVNSVDTRPSSVRSASDLTPDSRRSAERNTSGRRRSDAPLDQERSSSESPPSLRTMELEAIHAQRAFAQEQQQVLAEAREAIGAAIAALVDARSLALDQAGEAAADLAMLVARRVIGREVRLDKTIVRGLIAEGLHALAEREPLRVDLGPGFASMVEAVRADLALRGIQSIVHVDEEMAEFGCTIRNDLGSVDESIETRLDVLMGAIGTELED
jgi:flagellar biosynthesis/type III secretory pathway protein FliH